MNNRVNVVVNTDEPPKHPTQVKGQAALTNALIGDLETNDYVGVHSGLCVPNLYLVSVANDIATLSDGTNSYYEYCHNIYISADVATELGWPNNANDVSF